MHKSLRHTQKKPLVCGAEWIEIERMWVSTFADSPYYPFQRDKNFRLNFSSQIQFPLSFTVMSFYIPVSLHSSWPWQHFWHWHPPPHLTHTYRRKESKKRGFNFAAASFSLLFLWGPNNWHLLNAECSQTHTLLHSGCLVTSERPAYCRFTQSGIKRKSKHNIGICCIVLKYNAARCTHMKIPWKFLQNKVETLGIDTTVNTVLSFSCEQVNRK